jgi:hypothetical protein
LSKKTEDDSKERGTSFIFERIEKARQRISVLNPNDSFNRDSEEIWETYCDVEEAILMAKVVFRGFDRPGRLRKLLEIKEISEKTIRASMETASHNLDLAYSDLVRQRGNELVEHLRAAREQLKSLVITVDRINSKSRTKARRRDP